MANAADGWTSERVAELAKCVESGWSASQIAKRLGGVSRSAVIGKAWRLGLALGGGDASAPRRSARSIASETRENAARAKRLAIAKRLAVAKSKPPSPARIADAAGARREIARSKRAPIAGLTLFEVRLDSCRWCLGGAFETVRFCAALREEGSLFCAEHRPLGVSARVPATHLERLLRRYL